MRQKKKKEKKSVPQCNQIIFKEKKKIQSERKI